MLRTQLPPTWGITVVRVMMGIILIVAGIEKFSAGVGGFSNGLANFGIPAGPVIGPLVPTLELLGGILVLLGLGARWVACYFVFEFIVTTFYLKVPRQPPFGGWDSMRIDLMLLAGSIMLVLVGPGELALEDLIRRRRAASPAYR